MKSNYYVGQIPADPVTIQVIDQNTGSVVSLNQYSAIEAVMLDPQNSEVDLDGLYLGPQNAQGKFLLVWPGDRSLFERAGEYVLQLKMITAEGRMDFTGEYTIRVKELGGK